MRMENEIKMSYFQSRYAALNLTTLSRLYASERGYSQEERQQLKEIARRYALEMVEKLKIIEERQNSFGNDIGSILFQLKKMKINDIPDIYIYFEKLCE